ncbi:hypothetical protein DK846_10815 [Methanospirillum lacunae]|uniref:Fe/B12 periplasmic-binding domain-containing protein n=2 Tax=Methanospirillum lacunae TaxID=668570 RepID=A0A2V2MVF6_9EURY|nr:hypothetical protein DK846_10815 [Methanospirillum lacunae]
MWSSMTNGVQCMGTNFKLLLCGLLIALLVFPVVSFAENKTITDLAGNTIQFPANVNRIVTVDPFTSQFFFVIGADNKLVGTCVGPADRNKVNETENNLGKLPNAGCKTNVNLEQLIALKPELVISDKAYSKVNEDIAATGIPVAVVDVESPDTLMKSYEMIGKITGKEKEAEEFISYYNGKVDELEKNVADYTDVNRAKVYFGQREPLSTLGDDWYEAKSLGIAGGYNVAQGVVGGDSKVTLEQIYNWNPDDIILLSYNSKNVTDILTDSAWKDLTAVKKKQVYRMPKYIMAWELPVPENVLGMMWLQNTLYPDHVHNDLTSEIKEFYQKFYRLTLTDKDVAALLADKTPVTLNKPSSP